MGTGEYVFLVSFVVIIATHAIAMVGGFDRFYAKKH